MYLDLRMFRSLYRKARQEHRFRSWFVRCVFRASVCSVQRHAESPAVSDRTSCKCSTDWKRVWKHYSLHCPALCLCFHTHQGIWWRYTHAFWVYSTCVCVCVCEQQRAFICQVHIRVNLMKTGNSSRSYFTVK